MIKRLLLLLLTIGAVALTPIGVRATTTADVIFIVDESGSMGGEHAWLGTMVSSLESALNSAGVTGNRYGLVGFGAGSPGVVPHKHLVGGGDFGTSAQFSSATGSLLLTGGIEDGWAGIKFALDSYSFRSGAAVNLILVTDEDRDNVGGIYSGLSYASLLADIQAKGALLNAVINSQPNTSGTLQTGYGFFTDNGTANSDRSLGHDADGTAYVANGSGGYTTDGAGVHTGFGTTIPNYYDLALATGGAAWDLNLLRLGGNTATSFTEAFVDIKVQEILAQVPDAGSAWLLLTMGLAGLHAFRRQSRV